MRRRAFTVVELLVAVVMLTAIIVATGKIFSTASKVSSAGEATADVLQQAAVLQEQLKRDIAAICRDGYFAIQCVAVRNDVVLALDAQLAGILRLVPRAEAEQLVAVDDVGADEAALQIRVDLSGTFRGFGSGSERPGT